MPEAALFIPLAHIGHFLWILYVLPVLIVVASIVKTTVSERRKAREEEEEDAGSEDLGEPPLERR
jgi:cytochrome c-type biogenesis protein CcmH/NrfF